MEVMGLMLGQFLDDYTISCIDVFAMPQVKPISCIYFVAYLSFMLHIIARYWC